MVPDTTTEPPPRERSRSKPTCPTCDDPVVAVVTAGPTLHRAHPCGHRVGVIDPAWQP
jgi:transposase